MEPVRWRRLRELFELADGLEPAELPAFLDRECGEDVELRRELESLLRERRPGPDGVERAIGEAALRVASEERGSPLDGQQSIGKYRLLEKLGEGGMGAVFRAEDPELNRQVALKVLGGWSTDDAGLRRRLRREARALATLNHPNIVTVYSVERAAGLDYLTTELVEGSSLDQEIPEKGLGIERLLEIAVPLCGAVAAAHQGGVIHRDLKPSNVMVTDTGEVKVLDFGLAKLGRKGAAQEADLPSTATLTETGLVMGTLPYMSPEQAQGRPGDHRSDIFSLGVILYELASGERPFRGDSSGALLSSLLTETPPPISRIRSVLPPRLSRIIGRCLEKDPEKRYQDASELERALRRLQEAVSRHPRLVSSLGWVAVLLPHSRVSRRRASLALLTVLGLAGLMFLSMIVRQRAGAPLAGPPNITSLAVLPLRNLSGDPGQEFLANAMTDALITELSKIRSLKVIARTSIVRFKETDRPASEIARELGVEGLIIGSVARTGDRLQVAAKLTHAASDELIWAETFDREVGNFLHLQADVARAVAQGIDLTLTPREISLLAAYPKIDAAAAEAYLRGRHYWSGFSDLDLARAEEYFQQAIDIEPGFALAWAGLADTYNLQGVFSWPLPPRQALKRSKKAALRALELAPDLAEAHTSRGWIAHNFEWDSEAAESSFRRAIDLNPSLANAHSGLGFALAVSGEFDAAVAAAERALELDPLSSLLRVMLSQTLHLARRSDEALAQLVKQGDRNFGITHWMFWQLHQSTGEDLRAAWSHFENWKLDSLETALESHGVEAFWRAVLEEVSRSPYPPQSGYLATVHLALGERDRAFEHLTRACDRREAGMAFLAIDPIWDPLRSDPRFEELLKCRRPLEADPPEG